MHQPVDLDQSLTDMDEESPMVDSSFFWWLLIHGQEYKYATDAICGYLLSPHYSSAFLQSLQPEGTACLRVICEWYWTVVLKMYDHAVYGWQWDMLYPTAYHHLVKRKKQELGPVLFVHWKRENPIERMKTCQKWD